MKFGTMNMLSDLSECREKFKRLRELGFDACHLVYKPEVFTDEAAQTVKDSAEEYGIDVCAQFAGFRDTEIAWRCGFGSAAYFVKIFRQTLGQSPGAWRRSFV